MSVQRELDPDTELILIYLFFSVMLADDLLNPDGSEHTESRAQMYTKLLEYLEYSSEICVDTVLGTFLGIGTVGHTATELHLINGSVISVKLANLTAYHPPADPDVVFISKWQDDTWEEGALTWDTSIWR